MARTSRDYDVVVVGGSFSGLCFARHLLALRPQTRVAVIDRRPLPDAATRRCVGESTSEVAAWYLARRLGLEQVLGREHVVKYGLRFWLRGRGAPDGVDERLEFGPMGAAPIQLREATPAPEPPLRPHAYQLHRGRLEATLARELLADGAELLGGIEVEGVRLDERGARIQLADKAQLDARFVVDASASGELTRATIGSRAGERRLAHHLATAWSWVEGRVEPAAWASPRIAARCPIELRGRSTQHFVGPNYWCWLIPLADGSTSVGLIANDDALELGPGPELGDALDRLLSEQEPQLAAALAGRERLGRRRALRPVSRCFTRPLHRRWLVTGAALGFFDPLYSPGHDMTAIVHELSVPLIAALLDRDDNDNGNDNDERSGARIDEVNAVFTGIADYYATIYEDSWDVLADPPLAASKIAWDQLSYFAWLCPMAMSGWLGQAGLARDLASGATRVAQLNGRVQALLRDWARRRRELGPRSTPGRAIDLAQIRAVMDRFLALEQLASRARPAPREWSSRCFDRGLELLEHSALALVERAAAELELPLPEGPLNPYAIGLSPARWAGDGLLEPRRTRPRSSEARDDLDLVLGGRWCPS